MGIPTLKKCCCLELKWGALIVAIVDVLLLGGVCGDLRGLGGVVWYVTVLVHLAHIIACILVMVSICVPNKKLVIVYLITGIIRIIFDIILLIYLAIEGYVVLSIVIILIGVLLGIFFWWVIFSWYKMLGGGE
ncbi:uncharacterized protein LOC108111970 [Drosophila eugracilis]|uniref:uncharacterized protein LOC108111970 n=1 Tax=Drosophila eugracilis TaxID=29029 RepID=UPI0007E7AC0C|nr:uncharacterized protein LOC108111970 [Drosophila eugracilis]